MAGPTPWPSPRLMAATSSPAASTPPSPTPAWLSVPGPEFLKPSSGVWVRWTSTSCLMTSISLDGMTSKRCSSCCSSAISSGVEPIVSVPTVAPGSVMKSSPGSLSPNMFAVKFSSTPTMRPASLVMYLAPLPPSSSCVKSYQPSLVMTSPVSSVSGWPSAVLMLLASPQLNKGLSSAGSFSPLSVAP